MRAANRRSRSGRSAAHASITEARAPSARSGGAYAATTKPSASERTVWVDGAPHEVGGAHQTDRCFLSLAAEWAFLLDFLLDAADHGSDTLLLNS